MPANIWDEICWRIQEKVNRVSYDTWFLPTAFVAENDRLVTVRVPNPLFRDWIEALFHPDRSALDDVRRSDVRISFTVAGFRDADIGFHSIDERLDRVNH